MANPHPVTAHLSPWQPGESGNPAGRPKNTPLITPAMRHYAEMSYLDLLALANDQAALDRLPMKDVIAITMLVKAAKEVAWGDKTREDVIKRLDGEKADVSVDVSVGVLVRYVSNDAG